MTKAYSTDVLTKQMTTPYNERRSISGDTTIYVDGDPEDGRELVRLHDSHDDLILIEIKSGRRWLPFNDIDPDDETIEQAAKAVTEALRFAARKPAA
jgi:hypothetical protein